MMSEQEGKKRERILKIRKVVDELERAINTTTTDSDEIARAFGHVHPYLLNELLMGITRMIADSSRKTDGRILPQFQKLSVELWDGII